MAKKPATIIKELKALRPSVEWLPIDEVFEDTENPRIISEQDLEDLKKSITDFPQMMVFKGMGLIDSNKVLHTSNQRHRACKELGWTEFPIMWATGLTLDQIKELKIKDNMHSGQWDTDVLFKDWDLDKLEDWNFNMEMFDVRPFEDISKPNKTAENVKHQKTLHLKYTEAHYEEVKAMLLKIAETPEQAVWLLLHPTKAGESTRKRPAKDAGKPKK
jgi:hypothetical protein